MFEYIVSIGEKVTINTPYNIEFKDIKKEISKSDSFVRNISTYPNGLVIDMTQYADKIIVKSNRELIDNGDGTFTAPE